MEHDQNQINPKPASLFQRLQLELARLIEATEPGEKLISEPELARQLGVSRATLREAMRTFEGQGLIRRRQGVGTFVVSHTQVIENGLEVLESLEVLAKKIGLDVEMGDRMIEDIWADENLARELSVPLREELVKISRVIHAENRPVAYLIDILPQYIVAKENLQTDFTGSVLDLILRKQEPVLNNSFTEIKAVAASSEIARALEIQRGDVLQLFIAHLYDDQGRVVDYSHSYFLPGYFHFHVIRKVENGGNMLKNN
jgi:GntR family transcriptional regulator